MYSKVKVMGHPVHPMLVAFPVAFYTAALACYMSYNSNDDIFWYKAGYIANVAGIIMALVAAIPGFIDWLSIPADSSARKTGLIHLIANVTALVLFTISWFIQRDKWDEVNPKVGDSIALCTAGFVITVVAGFLGWTLVQKHHVGVDETTVDEKVGGAVKHA
jgi:uncharacterized membrane protein